MSEETVEKTKMDVGKLLDENREEIIEQLAAAIDAYAAIERCGYSDSVSLVFMITDDGDNAISPGSVEVDLEDYQAEDDDQGGGEEE